MNSWHEKTKFLVGMHVMYIMQRHGTQNSEIRNVV